MPSTFTSAGLVSELPAEVEGSTVEIARRHHRTKKNQVDDVDGVPNIDLRYVIHNPNRMPRKVYRERGGHQSQPTTKLTSIIKNPIVTDTRGYPDRGNGIERAVYRGSGDSPSKRTALSAVAVMPTKTP